MRNCFPTMEGLSLDCNPMAAALEVEPRSSLDPETLYSNAAVLSFCGQGDAALRQLRRAIQGNHCSYPWTRIRYLIAFDSAPSS